MEKPKSLKDINKNYIFEYIKEECTIDDVKWLKEMYRKPIIDKNGKEREISFISVRNAFVERFMPELMPKSKPKTPKMFDMLEELEKEMESKEKNKK